MGIDQGWLKVVSFRQCDKKYERVWNLSEIQPYRSSNTKRLDFMLCYLENVSFSRATLTKAATQKQQHNVHDRPEKKNWIKNHS